MNQPLQGVYTAKKKDGSQYYRASLTYRNKHISLGSHNDMKKAHEIYCIGSALLNDSSIRLEDYLEDSPLAFTKWVCRLISGTTGFTFPPPFTSVPGSFTTIFLLLIFLSSIKTICSTILPAEFPDAADIISWLTTGCRSIL